MVLDVLRALGRRWYVVVVGLLLTAGMVAGAYKMSPPKYEAQASVLMLPAASDVQKGGNPLLMLSGLEQPASILAAYFSSVQAQEQVRALAPTAEYEVALDSTVRGPVISVKITDTTSAGAMTALDYLLQQLPVELTRLQQQVNARGSVVLRSMPLTVDPKPQVDNHGTIRLMIAALVAGLVATVLGAVGLDGFLRRRRLVGVAPALHVLSPRVAATSPDVPEQEVPVQVAETAPAAARPAAKQRVARTSHAFGRRRSMSSRTAGTTDERDSEDGSQVEDERLAPAAGDWSWGGSDS